MVTSVPILKPIGQPQNSGVGGPGEVTDRSGGDGLEATETKGPHSLLLPSAWLPTQPLQLIGLLQTKCSQTSNRP